MNPLPLVLSSGALVLAACGGGGNDQNADTTTGATGARGYAETSQAVSDICRRANAEVEPITAKATGNARNDAPLIAQVNDANEKYVAELRAIEPDPRLKDAFDAYVASIEEIQNKAQEAQAAAESGDQAAYDRTLEQLTAADDANRPLARALGARECNKD